MLDSEHIKANIEKIKEEISLAKQSVTLLCATKTIPAEIINELGTYGITDIGENKVQELKEKYPLVTTKYNWHQIGALQTNKVKYIADKVKMIHSVDRPELVDEIDLRCGNVGVTMDVLIEVNIGCEENKSGIPEDKLNELADYITLKSNLHLSGLMTVMPIGAKEDLYARMQTLYENNKTKYNFKWLSMGMSDDYKIAIKYGANIIRIGKAIFGPRIYNGGN